MSSTPSARLNPDSLIDLSIAIVSFNTRDWLERTLASIYQNTSGISFDVWVIDNASVDGSAAMLRERFPQVRLIENATNEYIARPYNRVFRESSGRYILVTDSDIEYPANVLGRMVAFMDSHSDIGALCTPIHKLDGSLDMVYNRDNTLAHAFLTRTILSKLFTGAARRLENHFTYASWDRRTSQDIEVGDVCLMVPRKTIDAVGDYNEKLVLYFLQNDLCLRMRAKGWRVYYWADMHVVHAKSQSVGRVPFEKISAIYRRDMWHFYRTFNGWLPAASLMFLVNLTRGFLFLGQIVGLYRPKAKNMVYGTAPRS